MPFREEVLNATLALLLDQYDDITAAAEQRQGSEAIDITVQHNPTNNSSMVVEAKIGLSNTAKRDVVKQARERLETRPKAVAFGLCYPTELKRECSAQELKDKMINTKLTFAHVTRVDRRITWREGSIDDLAQVFRAMSHKTKLLTPSNILSAKRQTLSNPTRIFLTKTLPRYLQKH